MYKYYLWAHARKHYVRGKHKFEGCIFCGIAEDNPEVPKRVVHRARDFILIMNIFPYSPGHLEIIPKRHIEDIAELNNEEYNTLWRYVKYTLSLIHI